MHVNEIFRPCHFVQRIDILSDDQHMPIKLLLKLGKRKMRALASRRDGLLEK